jgi:hypothetical protein
MNEYTICLVVERDEVGLLQMGGMVERGTLLFLLGLPIVADKRILHVCQGAARDAHTGSVRPKDLCQSCACSRRMVV